MAKLKNKVKALESATIINAELKRLKINEWGNYQSIKNAAEKLAVRARSEAENVRNKQHTGEDQLRGQFARILFQDILGYNDSISAINGDFNYMEEKSALDSSKHADGLIGDFSIGDESDRKADLNVKAVIEWEDARYDYDTTDSSKGVMQAFNYSALYHFHSTLQKYVLVSNFLTLRLYRGDVHSAQEFDLTRLDEDKQLQTLLLFLHASRFAPNKEGGSASDEFYAVVPEDENPAVTAEAAKELGHLADELKQTHGYSEKEINVLLTRILFALFADDTEIFEGHKFTQFLEQYVTVRPDGTTNLITELNTLFRILNSDYPEREKMGIAKESFYGSFPYVNGDLFALELKPISLSVEILNKLREIAKLNWAMVNPIIFGSMFEGALNAEKRHSLGAHFTSEVDIRKVIDSLFLNDLYDEFNTILDSKIAIKQKLVVFKKKLANLNFLDPASGSGNFLIVGYRELRRLEHLVTYALLRENGMTDNRTTDQMALFEEASDIDAAPGAGFDKKGKYVTFWQDDGGVPLVAVEVSQFNGIEIQDYAVDVARVGMWIMDHLMNVEAQKMFFTRGVFLRIPLHDGANIVNANALTINWNDVIPGEKLDYIMGNPPFLGARNEDFTPQQKRDLKSIQPSLKGISSLDFVAGWFLKLDEIFQRNVAMKAALVSVNSIVQGVQAKILLPFLFKQGLRIFFAHQTFVWPNEGASVHVVIIGLAKQLPQEKYLFTYATEQSDPQMEVVEQINEYLMPVHSYDIQNLTSQISGQPEMYFGSQPLDNNHFYLDEDEVKQIEANFPDAMKYIKVIVGAQEITTNKTRKILDLNDSNVADWDDVGVIKQHVSDVKQWRLQQLDSSGQIKPTYKKLAKTPWKYETYNNRPGRHIMLPRQSSGNREYIPMKIYEEGILSNAQAYAIQSDDLYVMGILSTKMHNYWLATFGGKFKSDYRYSNEMVYNTFVFPDASEIERDKVRFLMAEIERIKNVYIETKNRNMRYLYNPGKMPLDLRNAHETLDDFVAKLYLRDNYRDMTPQEWIDFLYNLYLEK